MSRRPPPTVRRTGAAVGGAVAIVATQLGVVVLSLRLFSHTANGGEPERMLWAPVWAFSLALLWLAMVLHRDSSTGLEWFGPLLVAAAPFTAFGGGCSGLGSASVLDLHRSGVRIAVESGGCSTYLNGAVLVLGAALLALGLWVSLDDAA